MHTAVNLRLSTFMLSISDVDLLLDCLLVHRTDIFSIYVFIIMNRDVYDGDTVTDGYC